ncbi:MAG: futalosine hydrolase [bacterium]|nr:futalosine hydrolase [bacterium]
MILVVSATVFELEAFFKAGPKLPVQQLVCGIGPVEAALHLSLFLARQEPLPTAVFNIGIAGAYCRQQERAHVLDICLAEQEELGDLGKCEGGSLSPLIVKNCVLPASFSPDAGLRQRMRRQLGAFGIACTSGRFITVSCASGDREHGNMILGRYPDALCENMEGAALARVCAHFNLPFAELRCISNMVDDPGRQQWRLQEACARCGQVAALLFQEDSWLHSLS